MLCKILIFIVLVSIGTSTCPSLCATCEADNTTCLSCRPPHTFLPQTKECQPCNLNCTSCNLQGNCLGCKVGLQPLKTDNGSIICVPECRIPGCGQCGNVSNSIVCLQCAPGFYQGQQNQCLPCKSPCQNCTLIPDIFATRAAPFWRQKMANIFPNGTTFTTPNGTFPLPPYVIQIINSSNNPNVTTANGWNQAYYLYRSFLPLIPSSISLSTIVISAFRVIPNLQNKTREESNRIIVGAINQMLRTNYTIEFARDRSVAVLALDTVCHQCSPGFSLNTANASNIFCQSCNQLIPGCLACSSGSSCDQCAPGFFAASYPSGSCTKCNVNCQTCIQTSTTCTSCNPPMTLSSANTCVLCKDPCFTCSSSDASFCQTCKPPFAKSANSSGFCYRCQQDACALCDAANTTICTACRQGFTLNSTTNKCQLCPPNCQTCFNNTCYQCKLGHRLTPTGVCSGCGPGCLTCSQTNASLCYTCMQGTFYQAVNNTCQPCSPACLTCNSSATSCLSSKGGVVIFNNQAVPCRPGCKTCDPSNPQICTECQLRFILVTNVCKPCPKGCQTCSSPTVCTKCVDNLNNIGGECKPCQGNCRTCSPSNLTQCVTCIMGTNLVSGKCIRNCKQGCQQCSDSDSNICLVCNKGYSLRTDGKCVKCLKSCSGACDPKNINSCLSCADGFYLADNQCKRCPFGCQSCTNGQCSVCQLGFTLTTDSSNNQVCKKSCNYPCTQCPSTGCTACATGYNMISGICIPDISCNPNCQYCPIGTYNSGTAAAIVCTRCTNLCASCTSSTCTNCVDGYYLDSTSTCVACPRQCRSCYDALSCKVCASGFTKKLLSGTDISTASFNDTCVPCDGNCLTCDIQPNRCTSCPSDTYIVGSRCVNMFTVGFQYKIDFNYNTFLANSQSQNFINKIANISGVSINDTFINSIRQGSTVVSGSVSSSGSSNAQQIQQSLATGSTGYTVLSSSATVYYGDTQVPQQTKAKTNVGLIVGVTIGSVVAVAIIGFAVYKFVMAKKASQAVPIQNMEDTSAQKFDKDKETNQIVMNNNSNYNNGNYYGQK